MFLLEMLFDLFTAIPFWLSLTFIFCNLKFRRNNEHRKIYKRSCIALGTVNLFLIGVHYMAIFNSGPLHGVVVDRATGMPFERAVIKAYWSAAAPAPVRVPGWVAVVAIQLHYDIDRIELERKSEGEGRK